MTKATIEEIQAETVVTVPPNLLQSVKEDQKIDRRQFLIFVNPHSGRGKSLKILKRYITNFFDSQAVEYEVFVTIANFRVSDYIAQRTTYELMQYRAFIVVSGDGMVNEVVNAIMNRPDWNKLIKIPIAIIPTGSGNGLAYTLIGQSKTCVLDQKEAIELCRRQAIQNKTCSSDLVRITYGDKTLWSFLSIGWGLLANIDVDSDWLRTLGEFRFTLYGLWRSITSSSFNGKLSFKPVSTPDTKSTLYSRSNDFKPNETVLSITESGQSDDKNIIQDDWIHIEDKFSCIYAVYQSHISKMTRFAPKSTLIDGLIYLTYVRGNMSPCQVVEYLLAIHDGSHELLNYVDVVTVNGFRLQPLEPGKIVVDGEKIDWNISHGPLIAEIVPEVLNLAWDGNL